MHPRNNQRILSRASLAAPREGGRTRRMVGRPARASSLPRAERDLWPGEASHDSEPSRRLPLDSPERRRLPLLLRRAWYGLNQAFRHLAVQTGITPDQFTVLRTLHEHDPLQLTQRDLAERMSSDPNTIASLLHRMEHQGLIERRTNAADRRAHSLALKRLGQHKYRQMRRRAVALQKSVLAALPEASREGFLAQLELVANACREAAAVGRAARIPLRPPRRTRWRRPRRRLFPPA